VPAAIRTRRQKTRTSITRLTRDTGFEPTFDVRAGVADYVAWLRESPS